MAKSLLFGSSLLLVLGVAALAPAQTTHNVDVGSAFDFVPQNLTVEVGDTVTWTWIGGFHNVESGAGGIPDGNFDTIIINSVAQYFPGMQYLRAVLDGALRALAPGGRIFLGDLRHRGLLPAFHASVQQFRADAEVTRDELRERVRVSCAREEELSIDPLAFAALAREIQALPV